MTIAVVGGCRLRPYRAAVMALLSSWAAWAHGEVFRSESLPTSVMLSSEQLRLPQGERMGLVGGSLLFDIGGNWGVGPAVYGAATGERGGFFVGGAELQRRWPLRDGVWLITGLYAGGGGGAGAPVGGGLMLRPALTLLKDLGESLQAGVSWSTVRFPNGRISSDQLGLVLAWRGEFVHFASEGGGAGPSSQAPEGSDSRRASGLGFHRMSTTLSTYRLGDATHRNIGLVGARAERQADSGGFVWGMEGAAGAQGGAAGYMELLGTAAFSTPVLPSALPAWQLGVRLGAGLGGGGGVPTGGGLMAKATATTQWTVAPGLTVGAEFGVVRGNSTLRARLAQIWLGIDLEPDQNGSLASPASVVRTEWIGALQHHTNELRTDGARRPLDTVGLKLNRYLGDHLYVSGQAHSAFAGGAGAYSVGLLGAGVATSRQAPLRAGAELLVGAAGGGGVQTGGGAISQGLLWGGWNSSPKSEWRLGLGTVRRLRGGSGSALIELSWSRGFGMAGR